MNRPPRKQHKRPPRKRKASPPPRKRRELLPFDARQRLKQRVMELVLPPAVKEPSEREEKRREIEQCLPLYWGEPSWRHDPPPIPDQLLKFRDELCERHRYPGMPFYLALMMLVETGVLEPETRRYLNSELDRLYYPRTKAGEDFISQSEFIKYIPRVKDLLRRHGFSAHDAEKEIATALGISAEVLRKRLQRAQHAYASFFS
jgi:hypothetical protein